MEDIHRVNLSRRLRLERVKAAGTENTTLQHYKLYLIPGSKPGVWLLNPARAVAVFHGKARRRI
jgi:hypothetical protein